MRWRGRSPNCSRSGASRRRRSDPFISCSWTSWTASGRGVGAPTTIQLVQDDREFAWLAFLDGAIPRDGIVVVGATNLPGSIDPALLRPGRLDRHIVLPMPDLDALAGMVRAHLGPDAILTDAEVSEAAQGVAWERSPAQVQQLAREARRLARWCKRKVCASDLTDAVAMQRLGRPPEQDRHTAVHEAAHAVAAVVVGVDQAGLRGRRCRA